MDIFLNAIFSIFCSYKMLLKAPKPPFIVRMFKKYEDFYNSNRLLGSSIHTGNFLCFHYITKKLDNLNVAFYKIASEASIKNEKNLANFGKSQLLNGSMVPM